MNKVVDHTLHESGIKLNKLDAISVTQGPGLAGSLLTGVSFAKGLGLGLGIPLIPINHLEGHIFANFLANESLKFPFVCLLVSGGHTQLWSIKNLGKYILLGETRDDAAGEAFDKGARILGLGYPGGPEIENAANGGNPTKVNFPRSMISKDSLEFSFSGLKTSLLYFMDNYIETDSIKRVDVIASYQKAIIDVLVEKVKRGINKTKFKTCVIAGGVAANQYLRNELTKTLPFTEIIFPDLSYCTDNAAMIAYLGEIKLKSGLNDNLDFSINPNMKLI